MPAVVAHVLYGFPDLMAASIGADPLEMAHGR
jgi:hypothetical protein